MKSANDVKLQRWIRDHPDQPFDWDAPPPANVDVQEPEVGVGEPVVLEDFEGKDFGAVIDLLMLHGVSPVDANRYVVSALKANHPVTFHELYGRGGLCKMAEALPKNLNVQGLRALDRRTLRPDGHP